MDESGCDDDAGTKVFGDEEGPFGDPRAFVLVRENGKDSSFGYYQHAADVRTDHQTASLPNVEPTRITKMAEMRAPISPLYSLSLEQPGVEASRSACRMTSLATWFMTLAIARGCNVCLGMQRAGMQVRVAAGTRLLD